MRHLQRQSAWLVLLGWLVAAGWSIAVGAEGDTSFTLFAPSGSKQRLLVVRARPEIQGGKVRATLDLVHTVDLGFPGRTIAAHPTLPLVYVSGVPGKEGHNASVVPLDKADRPREPKAVALDRDYSYLATDRAGRFLLGCDYGSGKVDVYPLDTAGLPGQRVHGLDEGRKEAHCVLPSPDNRSVYIPYVKQNNALLQYAFDPATGGLTPLDPKDVGPPADSGPRHLVYHPRLPLVYFSEEQALGVSIYRRAEDGRITFWQRSRAVPAEWKSAGLSSSDVVITPDGRHLYTGIRGPDESTNVIACYAVGDDGSLTPRGIVPADKTPWGMALSPDGRFLAVTGYGSASLMLYAIAADGGLARSATLPWDEQIKDVLAR
jgi:6-phosphogluconolactonase (cycloisomerase 2 family)